MSLFRRARRRPRPGEPADPGYSFVAQPVPAHGYYVTSAGTPWRPLAPQATPNVQVGAYGYPTPTQVAAYWPDVQRKAGVEYLEPRWAVYSPVGSDVPYWLMTPAPPPAAVLLDGRRPWGMFGPAQAAALQGPRQAAQAQQQAAVAAGVLGN